MSHLKEKLVHSRHLPQHFYVSLLQPLLASIHTCSVPREPCFIAFHTGLCKASHICLAFQLCKNVWCLFVYLGLPTLPCKKTVFHSKNPLLTKLALSRLLDINWSSVCLWTSTLSQSINMQTKKKELAWHPPPLTQQARSIMYTRYILSNEKRYRVWYRI